MKTAIKSLFMFVVIASLVSCEKQDDNIKTTDNLNELLGIETYANINSISVPLVAPQPIELEAIDITDRGCGGGFWVGEPALVDDIGFRKTTSIMAEDDYWSPCDTYEPIYLTWEEFRSQRIEWSKPRAFKNTGKIYMKGDYVYVNEYGEGIHIIDNSDPKNPRNVGFIAIDENIDIAIKGNILYADNYVDLLAIDISIYRFPRLVKRVPNAYPHKNSVTYKYQYYDDQGIITGYNHIKHEGECDWDYFWYEDYVDVTDPNGPVDVTMPASADGLGGSNEDIGTGGSMARFAIVGDYLYIIDHSNLQLFDISNTRNPIKGENIHVGWNIETIYPYSNYLFIGSMNGMHIYDNSNPALPTFVSTYQHVISCDPVAVEGDLAYVTLRGGGCCMNGQNRLEIIDISDVYNPTLISAYEMYNPHGLGIDNGTLFLCDGDEGLKVFDATNPHDLKGIAHFKDIHAFDVIPKNDNLILIGDDGLYQYDYTDKERISLSSRIVAIKEGLAPEKASRLIETH